jgi:aspartate aminotransferase
LSVCLKEYLPIGGDSTFCQLSQKLAFGSNSTAMQQNRIATVQSLSGTGALRVGGEFLAKFHPVRVIYLPSPTWGNHRAIFGAAGHEIRQYRYYDPKTRGLDYQVRCEAGDGGGWNARELGLGGG